MRKLLLTASLLLCAAATAQAQSDYTFYVDTSSLYGTTGSLDFQFNPGPLGSPAASVELLNFSTDGTLFSGASTSGDVIGSLPSAVTIGNSTVYNDYFTGLTYGNKVDFLVELLGASSSSGSGSTFAFSIFSDLAGTVPALTTDTTNGFATLINENAGGTISVTNNSAATRVPENPSWLTMVLAILAILGACSLRLREQRQAAV